jgi:hypothetical protein
MDDIRILDSSEIDYLIMALSLAKQYDRKVRMTNDGGIKIATAGNSWTPGMGRLADASGHYPL